MKTVEDFAKTILYDCCKCNHSTRICFRRECTTMAKIALDMIFRGEY